MTPERLAELRSQYESATAPPKNRTSRTALPTSASDPCPTLIGGHDLVYPTHSLSDHMSGPGNDWLFLTGFPHDLRPSGWVYVKVEGQIVARVRARGVGYRIDVREHTPDEHGVHQLVASTPTLELDPETWELVDFPAAETHGQGIRYIETNDADGTVSHLVGGNVLITHPLR
jgi:hypothetical protein